MVALVAVTLVRTLYVVLRVEVTDVMLPATFHVVARVLETEARAFQVVARVDVVLE